MCVCVCVCVCACVQESQIVSEFKKNKTKSKKCLLVCITYHLIIRQHYLTCTQTCLSVYNMCVSLTHRLASLSINTPRLAFLFTSTLHLTCLCVSVTAKLCQLKKSLTCLHYITINCLSVQFYLPVHLLTRLNLPVCLQHVSHLHTYLPVCLFIIIIIL